jgi:serine/threonine-protein kinase
MIGRRISHYQVLERLGSGGMGEIYKAQDSRLNRMVAIKVLSRRSADDEERRRRFIKEAQAASSLNHPNIITIYDIVSEDENDFMVMEFVAGQTLTEAIPLGGLGVGRTLEYGAQMADALAAAHAAGIVHRDLKPGNVMATSAGRIKILDFGLAKVTAVSQLDSDETLTMGERPLTVEGSIIGTVSYMSPEQAEGKRVDARSDIFSFGVVLYEMITGAKAFWGDSAVSTLSAILRDEVKPIAQYATGVPLELEEIIMRALRKDPAQRWQSMQEMHARLFGLRQRYESGVLERSAFARPRRKLVPVLAAAAVAIAGGGWWVVTHRANVPSAPAAPAAAPVAPPPAEKPVERVAEKKKAEMPARPAPKPEYVLTNKGVIEMAEAKVSPSLIISEIRAAKITKFEFSVAEIIKLSKAGVPEEVVEVMRDPKAPPRVPPPGAPPDGAARRGARMYPEPRDGRGGQPRGLMLFSGFPVPLTLIDELPAEPAAGTALRFQVEQEVRIGPMLLIEKGAAVGGEIVAARVNTGGRTRVMFKLSTVEAADGSKVKLRAAPGGSTENSEYPLLSGGAGRGRGSAIPAGTKFLGYIDGDQPIGTPKR